MKRVLAASLGALLGLAPTVLGADEVLWRSVSPTPPELPAIPPTPPPPMPAQPAPAVLAAPTPVRLPDSGIRTVGWRTNTLYGSDQGTATVLPAAGMTQLPPTTQNNPPSSLPPSTPAQAMTSPYQGFPVTPAPVAAPVTVPADCAPPAASHEYRPLAAPIHQSFGSQPIHLSCDYPGIWDCLQVKGHGFDTGLDGWVRAEALLWWVNRDEAPPLVTTGPVIPSNLFPNGTPRGGALNDPGTVVLFGGSEIGDSFRVGGRFSAGLWLDCDHTCGIDGSFFFLARRGFDESFTSDNFPLLARPFFAPNTDAGFDLPNQFRELVAFPGVFQGAVEVNGSSFLWGAEANARTWLCKGCNFCLDGFVGFRYLDLDEDLRITEFIRSNVSAEQPPVAAGTQVIVSDDFHTHNRFYGGQVGLDFTYRWTDRFSLEARPVVALGATVQDLDITGGQVITPPPGAGNPTVFTNGGLLATATNIGHHTNTEFSVVPQITLTAGYQVTPWLRAFVGYDFLYWSNVLRPGKQIDPVVDIAFVPPVPNNFVPTGLGRPAVTFQQSDFWAQGISFGVELKW